MKKNRKAAALLFSAFFMALSLFSCNEKQGSSSSGELKVTFFDVGKADAIILQSETANVVIDCGEKGDGKKIGKLIEENESETIDYLIITHFDKDHVGGAAKLIRSYNVKNVLTPDYEGNTEEYEKYKIALAEKSITPMKLTEDVSFTLDGIDYTVYAPKKDFYGNNDSDENNPDDQNRQKKQRL